MKIILVSITVMTVFLAAPAFALNQHTDTFDGASGTDPNPPWIVHAGTPTHNGVGQLASVDSEAIRRNIGAGDFTMDLSWINFKLGDGVAGYESAFYSISEWPEGAPGQHFNIKIQEQPDSQSTYFFCRAWRDGDAYDPAYDFAANMGAILDDVNGSSYDLQVVYDDTALTFDVYYAIDGGAMTHLVTRDTPAGWSASTEGRFEYIGIGYNNDGDAAGDLDYYNMVPEPVTFALLGLGGLLLRRRR